MKEKNIKEKKIEKLIYMINYWIDDDMVKATATYKHWQHDKGSFAFGYYMALKEIRSKLDELIN
jgi:hypothetical protein